MLATLRKGMNDPLVAFAKYMMGYSDIGAADNDFNEEFYHYVREYQSKNNLVVDGIIGERSWRKVAAKAPTTSTSKNKKSRESCALQILFGLKVDGIFGSKTKAAVREYQQANGLTTDGIVGQATWRMLILQEKDSTDLNPNAIQPPNFKQGDSRWGKKMYSNHGDKSQTMASSGCGPTSMADIVAEWWDPKITPYDLALKSLEWKTRTANSGTTSTFFRKCAEKYKPSKYSTTTNIDSAIKCLNDGGYVIVCFGPGTKGKPWYQLHTKGGHYCVLWRWDGTYFHINDPASSSAKRAKSVYADVKDCRKGFYCFWK